jgi:mono/diheme cytochrome c family protein
MSFRVMLLGAAGVAALFLATVRGAELRAEPSPTVRVAPATGDTVPLYTAEQLEKGTALYARVCKDCHEDKDYTTDEFRAKWGGKPLYDLYEYVRTKMPDDNPGSLTRDEYAEALSYVLKLNGIPAGATRVMPDSAAMMAVKLELGAKPPL